MRKPSEILVWILAGLMVLQPCGCATTKLTKAPIATSPKDVLDASYVEAKAIEEDEKRKQDQVDAWLRVASMAIHQGDNDRAIEILDQQTTNMNTSESALIQSKEFIKRGDKVARAVGAKEEKKFFIGYPHEQLAANLYLGMLYFQKGNYEDALICFKNAAIADKGSQQDGYDSDCYLADIMQGICYVQQQNLGEVNECMRNAHLAYEFRLTYPVADRIVRLAVQKLFGDNPELSNDQIKQGDRLVSAINTMLPRNVSAKRDPVLAASGAVQNTIEVIQSIDERRKAAEQFPKEDIRHYETEPYDEAIKVFDRNDKKVIDALTTVASNCAAIDISPDMAALRTSMEHFDQFLGQILSPTNNVYVIHQLGMAPAKTRKGKYGEEVVFHEYPLTRARVVATISDPVTNALPPIVMNGTTGEVFGYQAKTVGGRAMDHILADRVVYRDTMKGISSIGLAGAGVALVAATVAASTIITTTTTSVYVVGNTVYTSTVTSWGPAGFGAAAPALAVAGGAFAAYMIFKAAADAMHPEGDIRGWNELPNVLLISGATVPPGTYQVKSDYYDVLGRQVSDTSETSTLTVTDGKPTLLLTGNYWES